MTPLPTYSPAQVAEMLGVSERWLYDHAKGHEKPEIPSRQFGRTLRFRSDDVERIQEMFARPAGPPASVALIGRRPRRLKEKAA